MAQVDVVVLGTGGAGLTAAIAAHEAGARVAVFEKHSQVGGTTAWSGGMIWIPDNHHEHALGVPDSRDEALTYLKSLSHGLIEPQLAEAFIDAGPKMVRFLEDHTPVVFRSVAEFPDYHAEHPGGKPHGGRSLECPHYPFVELGEWSDRVTRSPYYPDPRIAMSETPLGRPHPEPIDPAEWERRALRDERGCGQALIGRLLKGCLDRGIEPRTGCRGRELILRDGAVAGVVIETAQGVEEVGAKAVILASGGFEWNPDFRRAFLRGPMTHPISIPTNTGDGLRMAMKAGAMLGNMREAWWAGVAEVPVEECSMGLTLVMAQRTLPRSIMVNRKGRRFVNEAANYNDFGRSLHEFDAARYRFPRVPSWLIFDARRRLRPVGPLSAHDPDPPWLVRDATVDGLAHRIGIPPERLRDTLERFNEGALRGIDADHGRGSYAFDRFSAGTAELRAVREPPFYALRVMPGCLGTKGGLRIDQYGRVLSVDGAPIEGLYAAGNAAASPFGCAYPGGGATIGPALVFGWAAGEAAAAA